MRTRHRTTLAALSVAALLSQGCLLLPEIEERIVELAVGGSTTQEFVASGELNTHDESHTVDLRTGIDLPAVLSDAGVDVSDVQEIKLAGAAYRVTQQDPTPNRAIQNGTVTIQRGLAAPVTLVADFDVAVNDPANLSFQNVTLDAAGVAVINDLLADVLAELNGGPPATDTIVTIHVTGDSSPPLVATDFKYEIRLDVSILGTVKVDVPN